MAKFTPEQIAELNAAILRYPPHTHPVDILEEEAEIMAEVNGLEVDYDSFDEVRAYLNENIAESDWHTAAPAAPLVHLAPQQVEPATGHWDGPLRPIARTPFDDVFDLDVLEEYRTRLPAFKTLTGRFEPFDVDKLRDLFDNQNYSTFLKRPVLTFKDALDHSILLALFWLEEDMSAEESKQTEFVLEPDTIPPPGGMREERIEAAKQVWKEAVAYRKKVVEELDARVAAARVKWHEEKSRLA